MIPLTVACVALAAVLIYVLREHAAERDAHRAEIRGLVDQIVLLKVDPPQAALRLAPEPEGDTYISSTDDAALAEHEEEARRA